MFEAIGLWMQDNPAIFFGGWLVIGYLITIVVTWSEGEANAGSNILIILFWPLGIALVVIVGAGWVIFGGPHEYIANAKKRKEANRKAERESECQA
jgi:hypothetical protein